MKDYIARLQQAIRDLHGCESQYLETVPVIEAFQGKIIWAGDVEVFQIRGHLKPNTLMRGRNSQVLAIRKRNT